MQNSWGTVRNSASLSLLTLALALAGCGGGSSSGGADNGAANLMPPALVRSAANAQTGYDAAVAAVASIPTPAGGATILSATDIIATQTAFDTVADGLLAL
jgi:Flp pilus assembly protein TadD